MSAVKHNKAEGVAHKRLRTNALILESCKNFTIVGRNSDAAARIVTVIDIKKSKGHKVILQPEGQPRRLQEDGNTSKLCLTQAKKSSIISSRY
jgi:hypothetical protein